MRHNPDRSCWAGVSLVELLISLLLTAILMAGMARVFRESLSGAVRGAERLSSARRGRVALVQLAEDLQRAGLLLRNPALPSPALDASLPMFRLEPNQSYAGTDVPSDRACSDVLSLYLDEEISGEGRLEGAFGPGHAQAVHEDRVMADGGSIPVVFPDDDVPRRLRSGQFLLFTAGLDQARIQGVKVRGRRADLVLELPDGIPAGPRHPQGPGSRFQVVEPAQYLRWKVEGRKLGSTLRPCLVRERFDYGSHLQDPDVGPRESEVVAEDVVSLKVYLSRDHGQTWSGFGSVATSFVQAHRTVAGFVQGDPVWLRSFPCMVRLDLTTRTPLARQEYGGGKHHEQVHTLVLSPRHAGMPW